MSNIINAIINLVNNPILELKDVYARKNRANNTGDALEEYVKDLFSGTYDTINEQERLELIEKVFSYLGNDSNPPDAMLRNGDAIEVKKIESPNSALALNSSYPKNKLYATSQMISKACKIAENWEEKDMIYVTGVVKDNNLKHLSFVYGDDYCAENETYDRIKNTIKHGIETMGNIEFAQTKELGRVNKIDPLGITYLRIRGMWGIENPWSVFEYVYERNPNKNFNFMCIINQNKWNSFENTNELINLSNKNNQLSISDIKIKDPNNPAKLKEAKLISFEC